MNAKTILLVEDRRQDELLILRSLHKINLANQVDVVRDGQQALDYLLREGEFAGRGGADLPTVVLLDIGLPRVSGLEVLERLRADPRTRLLPVVILIHLMRSGTGFAATRRAPTVSCASPWSSPSSPRRWHGSASTGLPPTNRRRGRLA